MINLSSKKVLIVGVILLVMWLTFLWFIIEYAKDLRSHPCSICAEKIGEEVICSMGTDKMIFTPDREVKLESDRGDDFWGNLKS